MFFERGGNDEFTVELITGGNFATPICSDILAMTSTNFASAGFSINTVEITGAQEMFVGGVDFADFGVGAGDTAFGFRLSSEAGHGPDLGGFFLVAEKPDDFGDPIAAVPLPASIWLLFGALGMGFGATRMRRTA